jgi:mannitol-specific phosphotransferase system IIBC component
MIGRVLLGCICTILTLYIAVRSDNEKVRTSAAFVASCLVSFTATTALLERSRRRKSQLTNADMYVDLLRQMNREQRQLMENQTPKVCQGCSHYHGRTYGGERLICAMHPYGVEQDYCHDWEASDSVVSK